MLVCHWDHIVSCFAHVVNTSIHNVVTIACIEYVARRSWFMHVARLAIHSALEHDPDRYSITPREIPPRRAASVHLQPNAGAGLPIGVGAAVDVLAAEKVRATF